MEMIPVKFLLWLTKEHAYGMAIPSIIPRKNYLSLLHLSAPAVLPRGLQSRNEVRIGIHYIILAKWWMGILILIGLFLVDWLVLYEIAHSISRKENKTQNSSRSSYSGSSSSKTDDLVRTYVRDYVKKANYNVAKLGSFHINVTCTKAEPFVTVSGDVSIDVTIKFGETTVGALSNISNNQMIIDAKTSITNNLYANARKALEMAASKGAKLSGKYSIDISYEV